jgi:4-hydroxyphenylacetate 3-monooxygenase/anthranilate 3-monooxygenase (FAD)/4-hydroxyphenylacetate 3-monooxygenase
MTARTGQQYIDGLRDDRAVWLGNEKIDILTHPAMAGSVRGMAGYFDWQNAHAEDCLVPDPDTGAPMNASLIVPRNADDLARRHRCFDRFARYSFGMLGRTPDYVNVTLAGFNARSDMFTSGKNNTPAERLKGF